MSDDNHDHDHDSNTDEQPDGEDEVEFTPYRNTDDDTGDNEIEPLESLGSDAADPPPEQPNPAPGEPPDQAPYPGMDGAGDEDESEGEGLGTRLFAQFSTAISGSLDVLASLDYVAGLKATFAGAAVLLLVPLAVVLNVLPATWKLYERINLWSAYQMQKASSADAVANVRLKSGKEALRPAKWVPGAEDEKDRSGWKIKGVEGRFDPSVHERDTQRFGKADILHVDTDETEVGTWAEATMDNAIQLDRERYLFRNAVVQAVFDVGRGPAAGNGQPARADGGLDLGELGQFEYELSVQKPGIHEETLVPLSSREGFDGQVVSWTQYNKMKEQRSDQETVRDAKNSAWAAAKLDDIQGKDLFKWVLMLGAIGAVLLFHAEIGAMIAGLTGGGGGGGGAVGGAVSGRLGFAPFARPSNTDENEGEG